VSPQRITADSAPDGPAVAACEVSVTLGGAEVLSAVTAEVGRGEAVALLGGNGSGKTTLIRAMLGLVPHRGEVNLFGVAQARFRDWSRIGYVPQHAAAELLHATVREVVSTGRLGHRRPFVLPGRAERQLIEHWLEQVGLAGRERTELGHLSGGQRQRAMIARALVAEPDLLVLDEPLAGIDLPTQQQLAGLLAGLKDQGMAILAVLHELGPLDPLTDRALVLSHGVLVHDGPPRGAAPHQDRYHHHPDADQATLSPLLDSRFDRAILGER
jgi:zinc transport system ATP-binding protein